jgi:hypothetical protein
MSEGIRHSVAMEDGEQTNPPALYHTSHPDLKRERGTREERRYKKKKKKKEKGKRKSKRRKASTKEGQQRGEQNTQKQTDRQTSCKGMSGCDSKSNPPAPVPPLSAIAAVVFLSCSRDRADIAERQRW